MQYIIPFFLILLANSSFAQTIDPSYNKYDFIAGEKTIFDGNIPLNIKDIHQTNWKLNGGEASVVTMEDQNCISVDEYYTKLIPMPDGVKTLPDSFSIEYDTWLDAGYDGNTGIEIHLTHNDDEVVITPNKHAFVVSYPNDGRSTEDNPEAYFGENKFYNRWVHISIAVWKSHVMAYLDQYKMADIANCNLKATDIVVTGNSSQNMRMLLKNFRIATVFPAKITFQNNRFVTHAIRFDVNKYTLKPESIVVLKDMAAYMQANKTERYEIGGHTDSDGTPEYNLKLSQQRAEAVVQQLISMGIDKNRLTAKGYGQTKPIDLQNSQAAKAMNRRVEFTKL